MITNRQLLILTVIIQIAILFSIIIKTPQDNTLTKVNINQVVFSDTVEYILADINNNDIISKYVNKLPYKDVQIKYMNKYGIPLETGILVNFIESNFSDDLQLQNKCFNSAGGTDLGSMQINTKYHPQIEYYVQNNDIESYYDYAYKHLRRMKNYAMKKNYKKHTQLSVLCWNSKTPSQQALYESNFLKRANGELKQIYGTRVY